MCKHVFLRPGKERPFTGLCESAVKSTGLWPQSVLRIPTTQWNTEQWTCTCILIKLTKVIITTQVL